MDGKYKEAVINYNRLLGILTENNPSHLVVAYLHHKIGLAHVRLGNYEEAIKHFTNSYDIFKLSLPINHQYFATLLNNIGYVHQKRKNYLEALKFYTRSLSVLKELVPSNHAYIALSLNSIATVLHDKGDYENALEFLKEAEAKLTWSDRKELARILNNIDVILKKLENFDNNPFENFKKSFDVNERPSSSTSNSDNERSTSNSIVEFYDIIS